MKRPTSAPSQSEKRNKLNRLGRSSYASKSAIDKLCKAVREEGLPEATSRSAQFRARKGICSTRTPFSETLVVRFPSPTKKDPNLSIGFLHPLAMLYYCASMSSTYAGLLRAAQEASPCAPTEPWSVILYQDGVNPADGLATHHTRKSNIIYWSIKEFGLSALCAEQLWFAGTLARSSTLAERTGGVASITEIFLNLMFDPEGCHAQYEGVELDLCGGGTMTVYLKLGIVLADEPGIKEFYGCKGHAGHKPCILCKNATNHNPAGGGAPWHLKYPAYAKSIAQPTLEGFELHTDTSVRNAVVKLDMYKQTCKTIADFENKEQIYGFTWSPVSIVKHHSVRVISTLMFDWAHCLVCDGICDHELGQFMRHMHFNNRTRTSFEDFRTYLAGWVMPKHHGNVMHLFTDEANKNNHKKGTFNCTAGEFMAIAPLLKRYLKRVVMPRGAELEHVQSMVASLEVLELCMSIVRGHVTPAKLHAAITKHSELYIRAYGVGEFRPKHHYVQHLPQQLAHHGLLLSTYTQERRHRLVKTYTRNRVNPKSWELGAIEEITCHAIWEMENDFLKFGVQGPHAATGVTLIAMQELYPSAGAASLQVSNTAIANNGTVKTGDFALFTVENVLRMGEVVVFMVVDGDSFVVMSCWDAAPAEFDNTGIAKYRYSDSCSVVRLHCVECPVQYFLNSDGQTCWVYLPPEYRHE